MSPPVLDWRHPRHWRAHARPCRYCGAPTRLRDSRSSPAHKTCAEEALACQAEEQAARWRPGTLP